MNNIPEAEKIIDQAKEQRKALETKLSVLQQKITQAKIPVIIIFEGFSASGKGAAISSLILNFDPRGFTVHAIRPPEGNEKRLPWLARFAEKIPAKGRMSIFDRSWYSGIMQIGAHKDTGELLTKLKDINMFESQLIDDGYVIIKFFLDISKKEQKKRVKKLIRNKDTRWRVSKQELEDLKKYDQINAYYETMIEITGRKVKWHIINASDRKNVQKIVFETVAETLETVLAQRENMQEQPAPEKPHVNFNLLHRDIQIENVPLDMPMDRLDYRMQLKALQKELKYLHNIIYRKKVPVIMAFEGNDAAGKGGSIKRLAQALDPRGYEVIPIGAPTQDEISRHFLWRFYKHLPKAGHIAIYDRTWYGRVLVERVEGFASKARVMQAYNEIDEFEKMLTEWGALVLKFWIAIDKDEQLARFQLRQNTPEKQWKITDEDWRNRDKWDLYVQAINEMIKYTDTDFAPWHIVESNNKLYARIKTLSIVVSAIKKKLGIKEDEADKIEVPSYSLNMAN